MQPRKAGEMENKKATELSKAALESLKQLGLSPAESALVLGITPTQFTSLKKGERTVDGYSGEAERADMVVRVVKRLSTLLDGGESAWRSWIRRQNPDWSSAPLDLMRQREGLAKVTTFLERTHALKY
jgi:hypothetical protein